jgi:hypothetical protein
VAFELPPPFAKFSQINSEALSVLPALLLQPDIHEV